MRRKQSGTTARLIVPGVLALAFLWFARATPLPRLAAAPDQPALVTLSIVGTSDLHGAAFPGASTGGLPLLAGYVNNLRAARASDGGAVLLIELEGMREGMDDLIAGITALCNKNNAREVRIAQSQKERALLWAGRKNAFGAMGRISPDC